MKSKWDESSYRWARDSSKYTGYDVKLSEMILDAAGIGSAGFRDRTTNGTLCDMGCGAGELDLVLAPYFSSITCVDIDEDVIYRLSETIRSEGYANIQTISGDGMSITQHFDRVMAVFHARDISRVRKYLEIADKQLILVVRASRMTEIGIDQYKALECFDSFSMRQALDNEGIKYRYFDRSLEHGQPFRSYEDAVAFVKTYCEIEDDDRAIKYCRAKIRETGETEFPYYLPKTKNIGIFIINKTTQ